MNVPQILQRCTKSAGTSIKFNSSRFIHSNNNDNAYLLRGASTFPNLKNSSASHATHPRCRHSSSASASNWHGTTILCVRKNNKVCMMGDGMVSQGPLIVKPNAKKIRRITSNSPTGSDTIVGFAGSTADAFTLLERLEGKLDEYPNQLARSCVELAKGWRTDKYLRRLEASLIVADGTVSLELTGNGDVLESHDGILSVGSGGPYALAAARALKDQPLDAEEIARKAMEIASEMCVYTNDQFMVETITIPDADEKNDE